MQPVIVTQSGGGLKALGKRITQLAQGVDPSTPGFQAKAKAILDKLDKINEEERLRGVDRFGRPLPKPKYRPVQGSPKTKKGARQGKFSTTAGYGNLPKSEYLKLTGPRLAPRRLASRIISNYVTGLEFRRGRWIVRAGWLDILDTKGRPFLQYHLNGSGKLPKVDIGAISDRALKLCRRVAIEAFREEAL